MKPMRVLFVCLAAVMPIMAQGKAPAFKNLGDLNAFFDKAQEDATKKVNTDKLAALDAFLTTAKDVPADDLADARMSAAELAAELGKHEVAKGYAEKVIADCKDPAKVLSARVIAGKALTMASAPADKVVAALKPVIEAASLADQGSVQPALEAAQLLADFYLEQGNKEEAKKVWESMGERLNHPQLKSMFDSNKANVELVGQEPKPIKVKDIKDQELDLAQFKGKVVLIDFWATWCSPCVAELPNVIANYKKYHKAGFEVVGISLDESKDKLDKFLASHEMPWRQFFDGKGWENEVAQLYEVHSIPATYLLDKEGKVYRIGLRGEALGKTLEKLLAPAKPDAKK